MLRPTWAEIDLDNFCDNIRAIARLTSPASHLLAVIKADGYGCGSVPCALAALKEPKVKGVAVATPDEALELRGAGVPGMILVLGPSTPEAILELVAHDVSATVTDISGIEAMERAGLATGKKSRLHLKVDTGMSRLGFRPGREIDQACALLRKSSGIHLEGVYTHFAAADEDEEYTKFQWRLFQTALGQLQAAGLRPAYKHAANSAAILSMPESHLDLVRPGIMLYGSIPGQKNSGKIPLKPVLTLKSRVAYVKRVPPGTSVGYGRAYTAAEETTIATVPIGYADGYPRNLSGVAPVLIRGRRHKLAGRVCMDQIMVDTRDIMCETGDLVTLIGRDGQETITADEIASLAGTIVHEILTGIGKRVPRVYRYRDDTYSSAASLIEKIRWESAGAGR